MNGIRGILLAILVALLTLFSVANGFFVQVNLGFRQFSIWLPVLMLIAFLIGFLPVWLWMSADRLLLRRKLARLQAVLATTEADLERARIELLRPPAIDSAPRSDSESQPE